MGAKVESTVVISHPPNGDAAFSDESVLPRKRLRRESSELLVHIQRREAWKPPPSSWTPRCHAREKDVAEIVDNYYLEHWPFPSQKSKQKFLNAGFSRVTCLYFPTAKDDRIEFACRLLTILFLIDGELSLRTPSLDLSLIRPREYN